MDPTWTHPVIFQKKPAARALTTAIAHDEKGIAILDCIVEVKAPFNPTAATEQIAATLKSYGLHKTIGDKYAAEWVVDAFRKCGVRYEHSERDRSAIYLDALPMFSSGRVQLLDSKRLVTQFASLVRLAIGPDFVPDYEINEDHHLADLAAHVASGAPLN